MKEMINNEGSDGGVIRAGDDPREKGIPLGGTKFEESEGRRFFFAHGVFFFGNTRNLSMIMMK